MTSTTDTPAAGMSAALAERMAKLSPQQRELLVRSLARRSGGAPEPEAPWPRAVPGQALPLSSAQRQIWVFERLQPDSGAYLIYESRLLEGVLDVDALSRACERIVARHDALRMQFREEAGEPVQVVVDDCGFALAHLDLSHLPEDERERAMRDAVDRLAIEPIDLSRAPLLRMQLIRLAPDRHVLTATTHHIIADGLSLGVIWSELSSDYNALCAGDDGGVAVPLRYADYLLWQREPAARERLERQLAFWHEALRGTSGLLDLPTDRPRGAVFSARGGRHVFTLPDGLHARLGALARRENTTLFVLMLTAWQTLLSRYSGDHDIVVGSPVANRNSDGLQRMVGLFINTIALRGDLSGDPGFRDLLARNRDHVLRALENADAPLERVIEGVRIERAPGRTPLFQTMFVLQPKAAGSGESMTGLRSTGLLPATQSARFEMTLSLTEWSGGFEGLIDYGADLFEPETIARMARHYVTLMQGICDAPELPVSRLPLLEADERAAEIALGDGGPALAGDGETLHALFAAQTARTPDADALVVPTADGPKTWSYAQAAAQANGIAAWLHAQNIGREAVVAVLADRSAEAVLAVLGTLVAGAAYLPLDPGSPDERLAFLLADSGARALLVPPALSARAEALPQSLPVARVADLAPADAPPAVASTASDAAYLIYTSGSTGTPKGVVVEHAGAVNLVRGFLARHRFEGQRLLMIPPLIFDASVGDVFPALACGSALVLHPAPTELGSVELERFCRDFGVTAIDAPAALWRRWSEGWALASRSGPLLPSLQLMMIGGESVPIEQVRRFASITDGRVVLCNHYGPTEASVCATLLPTTHAAEVIAADLPIGRPLPGVRVYLLDAHGEPVPRGVAGELCIGGIGVARGYLGAPELSADRFVADPFAGGDARMYRTGDLARWTLHGDGAPVLQFIGRRDHQVKLRGVRIELGEIDNALASLPGVRAAATLLREDRPGDKRLVAYVVADAGIDAAALRAGLARRLPEAMLPSAWVLLASMPLNANGKIDRRALPAPTADMAAERVIRAPATATEDAVLAVWRDVLGRDDLSTDDDFFSCGGDSLSTLPLAFKLNAAFGIEVPLSSIFATPTIVGLAETIDRIRSGDAPDALDLDAKVVLTETIDAARVAPPRAPRDRPRSVLLTGATGFLGAYVLRDLIDFSDAEVVCLVRADTPEDGIRRIRRNLESYRLWRDGDERRLVPVLGDLGSSRLGLDEAGFAALADRVDAIVHNGGQVNFIAPYETLEAANVGGTREVLALATLGHLKPVQLVSTLGVYLTRRHVGVVVAENHAPPDGAGQYSGYNQSKWVGEQLALVARARGVPVAIHRPARITGDVQHGISNPGDYFNAWIRGCAQLGLAPHLPGDFFDMTPVDYVARTVVKVLLGAGDASGNYHYFNPRTLPATEAVAVMRERIGGIDEVPYAQWRRALLDAVAAGADNALKPFAGLFPEESGEPREPGADMPVFDCSATEAVAASFGAVCPPADRALFERYVRFLQSSGALPCNSTVTA
ncbi:non-ribosomal peptide synthetase family protein [Lysobacter brunescens]|uniref:Amino acid adenylation domain-containing protein n=1 Tax=Lysobacter brunescens TaxID=262323 RepID=A0ABW2YKW8_9GAMM